MTAFDWPRVLGSVVAGHDLDEELAATVMGEVMAGEADPVQVAGLLTALAAKGESAGEVAGFVRAMLDHVAPIELDGPLVDTCGTGGDGADTFNVSTVSALVAAAAGCRVAKHGNRSASSRCGSADLLEAWGVVIDLPPAAVARCVDELGIGFLYARTFHPAMRHVGPLRAALGIRTVFNVLGPLSNPARARHQTVGVSNQALAPVMAEALGRLGTQHALVFCGQDGLDELTTTGPSRTWEVRDGAVVEGTLDPADLGIATARLEDLQGHDVADNVAMADAVLAGHPGAPADIVTLNSAAALYVGGAVGSLADGVERAREVLASGDAARLRDRWVAFSQHLAAE